MWKRLIRRRKGNRNWAMRKAAHLRLGERGERLACHLLKELGMEILTRSYLGPHGEIDIVARDGVTLCFVEVKTRRRSSRTRPADSINAKKKAHIIHTARRYLRQLGNPPVAYRYDVVEIIFNGSRLEEARHWPAEFTSQDLRYIPPDFLYDDPYDGR